MEELAGGKLNVGSPRETAVDLPRPSARRRSIWEHALALLCAVAIGLASLLLFTRNNDFPLDYHPDEFTKVDQLASGNQTLNFHHPLLMLEAANLAIEAWSVPIDDSRAMVIAGRWTSAALAATGVVAIALAGYAGNGWIGLLLYGAMAGLCPSLLVHAHYLKEDAALIGAIGVCVLGLRLVCESRGFRAQLPATVLLAVGCAMAVSAKLLGVVCVMPALFAMAVAPLERWWAMPVRIAVFVVIAVVATVAINARAFDDLWTLSLRPDARSAMSDEVEHATTEHYGVRLRTPNVAAIRIAADQLMPHAWVFAIGGAAALIAGAALRRRATFSRFGSSLTVLVFAFAVPLCWNVIPIPRYALPLTVFGYLIAAALATSAIRLLPTTRSQVVVTFLCLGVVVLAQGRRCLALDREFADDSRQRVRQWIAANVPSGTGVVADWYANLGDDGDPWRFPGQRTPTANVWAYGFAGERGSVDSLWDEGIRYVVTCETSYERFFYPKCKAAAAASAGWNRNVTSIERSTRRRTSSGRRCPTRRVTRT